MRRIIFFGMEQYILIKCVSSADAEVILVTDGNNRLVGHISTYPLYSRNRTMLEKTINEILPDNQELPIFIDGYSYRKFFKSEK